jgi:hypothetical protein
MPNGQRVGIQGKVVCRKVFDSSFRPVVLFVVDIFSSGGLKNDLVIIRKYLGVMICAEPKRAASSDIVRQINISRTQRLLADCPAL